MSPTDLLPPILWVDRSDCGRKFSTSATQASGSPRFGDRDNFAASSRVSDTV